MLSHHLDKVYEGGRKSKGGGCWVGDGMGLRLKTKVRGEDSEVRYNKRHKQGLKWVSQTKNIWYKNHMEKGGDMCLYLEKRDMRLRK